jgi:hypothetical protein
MWKAFVLCSRWLSQRLDLAKSAQCDICYQYTRCPHQRKSASVAFILCSPRVYCSPDGGSNVELYKPSADISYASSANVNMNIALCLCPIYKVMRCHPCRSLKFRDVLWAWFYLKHDIVLPVRCLGNCIYATTPGSFLKVLFRPYHFAPIRLLIWDIDIIGELT